MCGIAGLMIIGQYIGIFMIIYYGIQLNRFGKYKLESSVHSKENNDDAGFKVLEPVDKSVVIEKHTLLAKIDKMINACKEQLQQLDVNTKEDYQLKRELTTVIDSYEEIRKIEVTDRLSLDYATFLFNDGKLRSDSEIKAFDKVMEQRKYVTSGEFLKEMCDCCDRNYLSKRFLAGILLFFAGFIPSCFYGFVSDSFIKGIFEWQIHILQKAFNPFEGGLLGELMGVIVIFPFILSAVFFVRAWILIYTTLEISHNLNQNVCRKKAGFKEQINKETIIAGVACIPTLYNLLRG